MTVTADDPGVAGAPDATASLALPVTDANDPPGVALTGARTGLPEALAAGARAPVAGIAVTDDALGSAVLGLARADAGLFEIDGATLFLRAGTVLDAAATNALSVAVTVSDPALGPGPAGSATFAAPVLDTTRAGTDGADLLEGGPAADILSGLGGDDRLAGGPGDDLLDVGPGRDTALFEGALQGFTITFGPGGVVVTERASAGAGEGGGADRLVSIEALDFALPGGTSSRP